MAYARKKIQKEKGAEPDRLEEEIAQAMQDLEVVSNDLKADLHDLFFVGAKEYDAPQGKKVIAIHVPFRLLKNYHRVLRRTPRTRERSCPSHARSAKLAHAVFVQNNVQHRLVRELEKKFSGKHVVIIAQRKIQQKPGRCHHPRKIRPALPPRCAASDALTPHHCLEESTLGMRTVSRASSQRSSGHAQARDCSGAGATVARSRCAPAAAP